jgi:ubiquinone/menaquinone biosynthesis C-methylase UbiE
VSGEPSNRAEASFEQSAPEYDEILARNRGGAERLVAALPAGPWRRVLDVGAGTGFASLAIVERFAPEEVIAVDASPAMLDVFRAKLAAHPEVRVDLHAADVLHMPVVDGAVDAVVSSMAFHWFPDKPAALRAMALALRPGGVMGILTSGRGTDLEFRDLLKRIEPPVPPVWIAAFDYSQLDERELEAMLESTGLEPVDIWLERRWRRAAPDAYLARIGAVASHLSSHLDPAELEGHIARTQAAVVEAAGPRGFEFTFAKLFGVARKPE